MFAELQRIEKEGVAACFKILFRCSNGGTE
jgi:hypothetical protein